MRRAMDIRQEGFWRHLRALIVSRNRSVSAAIAELEGLRKRSRGANDRFPAETSRARKSGQRQLRVFISYSSTDIKPVHDLYERLRSEPGLDLWFDRESLTPGDNWLYEITRAIRMSDMIVICLSAGSVRRRGFSQKEIKWALEQADEQPEGTTSILPVKLEPCDVPDRLAKVAQYAELFSTGGYERLVTGLRKRSAFLEGTGTK